MLYSKIENNGIRRTKIIVDNSKLEQVTDFKIPTNLLYLQKNFTHNKY